MEPKREAVILVPSMLAMLKSEQDVQRERLVKGLSEVPEWVHVEPQGAAAVEGVEGIRLQVTHPDQHTATLDVYEAYWGDLIPRLSQEELVVRVKRGTTLLFYWAVSGIWRGVRGRVYLTVSFIATAFILLAWYYSTVALLLTAIGENPNLLTGQAGETGEGVPPAGLLQQIAVLLGKVGEWMGGWSVWLAVALLMGFVPVNKIVDVSDFTRRYLRNETVDDGPVGLQDRLRKRVRDVVAHVCEAGAYERITIAAHSFGCMIAVDVLADYAAPAGVRLRLVTMGGPLEILSHRAGWVQEEIDRCASAESLEAWVDFYSEVDWFCSATPFDASLPRLQHCEVHDQASLSEKLTGETHQRYFGQKKVVHTLLGV